MSPVKRHLLLLALLSSFFSCILVRWSPFQKPTEPVVIVNGAIFLGKPRGEVSKFLEANGYRPGGPCLGLQESYQKEDVFENLQFSFDSSDHLVASSGDLTILKVHGVELSRSMSLSEVKNLLGEPTREKILNHARMNFYYASLNLHLIFYGNRLRRFSLEAL